jgi:hypothetical protein
MRLLLVLLLVAFSLLSPQSSLPNGGGLVITDFRFARKQLKDPTIPPRMVSDQPPTLNPNPNLGRVDRNESPIISRQREKDRLADMSKVGGISHGDSPRKEPPDRTRLFYEFTAQLRNNSSRIITRVVWAYRVSHYGSHMEGTADTEFICNVKIEAGSDKEVKAISRLPRVSVVDVSAQGTEIALPDPSIKDLVIKQIQFSDGSTWQQPEWNPVILTRSGVANLGKGKCITL